MFGWIFSDKTYTNRYHELFGQFINEWVDSGRLTEMIDATAAMIKPYVEKDPTKFCTVEDFEEATESLKQFVLLRGEAITTQLSNDK